ncbi:hypothetical protein [Streptacidiphilus rugosus]|uniref:hypothetical protein n=1 Tax=Streptacidiphilus rugosus TaxID=405783 RepID=UPI0012FC9053|nr:hypothetical protein [Streptacidiphilus rugosus]
MAAGMAFCGCSAQQPKAALKSPSAAVDLAGVCPATVVVQTNWEPEAEHAYLYHLIGPDYHIDQTRKRVSGPLVIDGVNTGVNIEVRAGGAAVGFQSVEGQMYRDRDITLGMVSTDAAVATSAIFPVTAVVAPLEKSPLMLMWDPGSHPDWKGIADIGRSGAKVLVTLMEFGVPLAVREGVLKQAQIDSSYDGSPARFVTNPTIAQQGYATEEPYVYRHDVPEWNKPIRYQLFADVGYNIYEASLSVRTGSLGSLSPCLTKLVPILQRSQVEYIHDPGPTNGMLAAIVQQYHDGWTYDQAIADYAARTMKSLGIVADDRSGPVGGMDMARVQSVAVTFSSIFEAQGVQVIANLRATDIATDRFINKGITLH